MDYRSITNVLGILRLIRAADPNNSGAQIIQEWAGRPTLISQTVILKVAGYITEQIDEAKLVMASSNLDSESKHGCFY
jgi:hypothetical protein